MTTPPALRSYQTVSRLLGPVAPKLLAHRAKRGKEDPDRLAERLGHSPHAKSDKPVVWVHGVSVGESLSLMPLIHHLCRTRSGLQVVFTSGTVAAAEILAHRLPTQVLHQYAPIDTPQAVEAFLDHWQPKLAIFAESELWPNQILGVKARGGAIALLSARITEKTALGWAKVPDSARYILNCFDLLVAQDAQSAERLRALGGHVQAVHNLKRAAPPLEVDINTLKSLRVDIGKRPVILAASTHKGEEGMVLQAFAAMLGQHPDAMLIIAPRHKKRAKTIQAQVEKLDLRVLRRSQDGRPDEDTQVYIADTVGEMGLWYQLSSLAIMGGSLLDHIGGHNPLEPARLGCPVVSGSYVSNFHSLFDEMIAAEATAFVHDADDIAAAMETAIQGDYLAMAERAQAFARVQEQALEDTWKALLPLLPTAPVQIPEPA